MYLNHRRLGCLLLLLLWWTPTEVMARDVRLALLVGNQYGWDGDPKLDYVLKGDLNPMARTLRRLGFKIHTVLANRDADALRKTFRAILRNKQRPTTFFFYYSGHADKKHFHMGPKGKRPLSYREFVSFLNRLKVKRRFAVIDACFSGEIIRKFGDLQQYRELVSKGKNPKGVAKELEERDLRQHLPNQGDKVRGLQILSSSQDLAFESKRRRSSVFTYHLLRGLEGAADIDKDGKISFNELFLYTKPKVRLETGQSPQQWLFRVGGETYGLAPVYESRLRIAAGLTGKLKVVVGSFYWQKEKRQRSPMHIAVTAGRGYIRWKRGKVCRHQSVLLAKGREAFVRAGQGWTRISCGRSFLASKGSIQLPPRQYDPLQRDNPWAFEMQLGFWGGSGVLRPSGEIAGSLGLGFRHRYFGLFVYGWGTSLNFADGDFVQLGVGLRPEVGYRGRWGKLDLFAGVYGALGLLLQDANQTLTPRVYGHFGPTMSLSYWISSHLSLLSQLDLGLWPTIVGGQTRVSFVGALRIGVRFGL